MTLYYSPGMAMRRDFGKLAKCPHCDATDITKITPMQVTCGRQSCRDARGRETDRQNALKKRRRVEAAKAVESAGAA